MIFLFSSNVLKQHDRRLDGILKTSYLLIMISLSLCKPKTISLLVKLNQLKEKKLSLRLGFTTGLESIFVYLETNLSCLLYVIHFSPLKKISIFEKRFLLSSLSLMLIDERLSVLHGFLVKIFRGCVARPGDDH